MVILLYCTICLGNTLYLILCSSDTVSFIYVLLNTECQTSTTIIITVLDQHAFGIVVTLSYRAILTYLIAVLLLHRELYI